MVKYLLYSGAEQLTKKKGVVRAKAFRFTDEYPKVDDGSGCWDREWELTSLKKCNLIELSKRVRKFRYLVHYPMNRVVDTFFVSSHT